MKTLRGEQFDSKVSKGINIMYINNQVTQWCMGKIVTRAKTFENGGTLFQRGPGIGRAFTRRPQQNEYV